MAAARMVDKTDLQALGFTVSKSADIIRAAKRLMVSKGYSFYGSRKVGRVPAFAAAEIIGVDPTGRQCRRLATSTATSATAPGTSSRALAPMHRASG